MTDKHSGETETIGGGFKAINYVMAIARQVGARKLSASVRSKNACKACAFGTGGQRDASWPQLLLRLRPLLQ